jgi:hypothetical protein
MGSILDPLALHRLVIAQEEYGGPGLISQVAHILLMEFSGPSLAFSYDVLGRSGTFETHPVKPGRHKFLHRLVEG